MNSFADDLRMQADKFLMESLLAEEVEEQNRKGLSICPKLLMESFVRKWRSRPRSDGTNHWLASLQSDQNMQSQWRRGFKRRWHLEMGSLSNAKCIGRADIRARTETYLRWLRWLCQVVLRGREIVMINMDETMVANVKDFKKGVVVGRKKKKQLDHTPHERRRVVPRCSVLGCITHDPELQKQLPQIFLPRRPAQQKPPQKIREVFSSAGLPIEAWHGTSGFLSAAGATCFLSRLRGVVRKHRPNARIVLFWDASVAHTNDKVLQHARRLHIEMVLVPGRLTWLLQPLDVYVFACLKRALRYNLTKRRMRNPTANISVPEYLRCCTESVQSVLVHKEWGPMMNRCGMALGEHDLSQKLMAVVEGSDLTAAPPSQEDIQKFIGCSSERAGKVHASLLAHLMHQPTTDVQVEGVVAPAQVEELPSSETMRLMPVFEPVARTSAPGGTVAAGNMERWRRLPRGRRLTPVPRNMMMRPLRLPRVGIGAATRSQRPTLLPGVVATDSQPRGSRARSSAD